MTSRQLLAKPILKWAGGKGQLLPQIAPYFPPELKTGEIETYVEPFVGAGAVFFWIAQNFPVKNFYIADINPELILLYTAVQKNVEGVIQELSTIGADYGALEKTEQKAYFLAIRQRYNQERKEINFKKFNPAWISRAAQIIFLNKTCFNGLYRVNKKGDFNVPFGDYKNPKICDADNLVTVSNILKKTVIHCIDFSEIKDYLSSPAFIYLDPPYRPLSQTSNFKAYAQFDFSDSEQKRLAQFLAYLNQQGHKVMLSNSDPKNIDKNDNFFDDLYSNFKIHRIMANRMINSKASHRGAISEILVTNY
ncbi:MAG: Dam family site-specific DNA-(adenine-N6)-methyltransferase [Cyanobacteria bacterium RI_101]|nr:Dam family site-specific DNA-(adenine-N6)-methyltransferase [Cyanobacteria bacterium RI_101]